MCKYNRLQDFKRQHMGRVEARRFLNTNKHGKNKLAGVERDVNEKPNRKNRHNRVRELGWEDRVLDWSKRHIRWLYRRLKFVRDLNKLVALLLLMVVTCWLVGGARAVAVGVTSYRHGEIEGFEDDAPEPEWIDEGLNDDQISAIASYLSNAGFTYLEGYNDACGPYRNVSCGPMAVCIAPPK